MTQGKEVAAEYYEEGRNQVLAWQQQLENQVREKPLQSVFIAAGIGLLYTLLRRRESPALAAAVLSLTMRAVVRHSETLYLIVLMWFAANAFLTSFPDVSHAFAPHQERESALVERKTKAWHKNCL